ncbi:hypothetical protein ABZ829_38090 [Streptomyces xanthochromogenes]|uniref:hypothetical protein n=1 Tax=Streptomyces xanthochromogenes TaxID=67384 RepID=UPI00341260AF
MSRTKMFAVSAVTGVAILGATPAFATNIDRARTGVSAWSHGANGQIAVADTKGDSHEVYANYDRKYNKNLELRNSSGNGTTAYSANDTGNPVQDIQACVAINFQPDDCTVWWSDR